MKTFVQYLPPLLVLWMMGAVAALTPQQHQSLAAATDGTDHQEPAFDALVENVRAWRPGEHRGEVRLNPDWQRLIENPGPSRGDLFRVVGVIQQQTMLNPPHGDVTEWFVRDDAGTPVIVFVVGLDQKQRFHDGQRVQIDARFYKRMDWLARDGQLHRYAALVGAQPKHLMGTKARTPASSDPWRFVTPIAAMVSALLVLFAVVRSIVSRGKRAAATPLRPGRRHYRHEHKVDGEAPLPDDPAAALAELKRRADST